MIWIFSLLGIVLVAVSVLFYFMVRGFINPVDKHKVPENLPFEIEEIRIPLPDGRHLYGWWILTDKDAPTIIFAHGWGRSARRMLPYLKKFCCQGFNLLAFDARGHGNSDSDKYSNLVKFADDIIASIDFVQDNQKSENPDFYLVGLSIGGAGSIYAAAHDKRIKKVVTVGAFAHPASVMKKQFKDYHIPYYPMIWLMFRYLKVFQNFDLNKVAPEKHIANAHASFLLIHGEADKTVPVDEGKRLLRAAGKKAELWIIPGRGHSDCHLEKGFWEKVIGFLALHTE